MTTFRRSSYLVSALLLGSVLAALPGGVASAHASLVRANIKPGQVFAHNAYPHVLTAFFAENIDPKVSWVHLFEGAPSSDHGMVDGGKLGFPFKFPKEITMALPAGLKGLYTVIWFTRSVDDGHQAANSFTFTVK